jgi:hypothetical protein
MSKEVGMVLFAAVFVLGFALVPVISLLIKHQQAMARILQGDSRSDQVEGQLESMRNEILQLNAAVGALKAGLTSVESHENGKELASRIGGSS